MIFLNRLLNVNVQNIYLVIMVGDQSVGKTSMLSRFIKNTFQQNVNETIAVEFATKFINIKENQMKLQIWDTSGNKKFQSISSNHYKNATGAMLVFDVTRKETFESIKEYLIDIKKIADPSCVFYLIGNKFDLLNSNNDKDTKTESVSNDEIQAFVSENKLVYKETSALSSYNINEVFTQIAEGN